MTYYRFRREESTRGEGLTNPMGLPSKSPRKMVSSYRQSFRKVKDELRRTVTGEVFNMEKEHRILNPHKMAMKTSNREAYKSFKVIPKLPLH